MNLITLNGIAPEIIFKDLPLVLAYELLTVVLECITFALFSRFKLKLERNTLVDCLIIVSLANLLTYVVGVCVYTAINGYGWLFASWGATPTEEFLAFLFNGIAVPACLILLWIGGISIFYKEEVEA